MQQFIEAAVERAKTVLVEVGLPLIEEKTEELINDTIAKVKDFSESIKLASKARLHVVETTFLDLDTLREIAKKYKVDGSKEVAACKKVVKNQYAVYLAYTVDKELLPVEINQYVVITCKALAPDVLELFDSNDLIILK